MFTIHDFIRKLREEREKEIDAKEKKGILIPNRKRYRYIHNISVYSEDESIGIIGVAASENDIFFCVKPDNTDMYFSIYEIYCLLYKIVNRTGVKNVVEILEKQIAINIWFDGSSYKESIDVKKSYIEYQEEYYYIPEIMLSKDTGFIELEDCHVNIPYKLIFVLLSLLQDYFNTDLNRYIKNGLMRLMIVLLSLEHGHRILEKNGWLYCVTDSKFYIEYSAKTKESYYLTEKEYNIIMLDREP